MTSEEDRRSDAREKDNPSAAGIPHFCGLLLFNVNCFSPSFSFLFSTLAIRLRLVIFRACSMFRSAAPISRSLSLSLGAHHTHTHAYVHAYTVAKPASSPPRCRSPSFSFRFLLLRPSCGRGTTEGALRPLSKKFVWLFKVNNSTLIEKGVPLPQLMMKFSGEISELYLWDSGMNGKFRLFIQASI